MKDEIKKDILENEAQFVSQMADHLYRMMAESMSIPVEIDGKRFLFSAELKEEEE